MIRHPRVASKSGRCLIPAAFFLQKHMFPVGNSLCGRSTKSACNPARTAQSVSFSDIRFNFKENYSYSGQHNQHAERNESRRDIFLCKKFRYGCKEENGDRNNSGYFCQKRQAQRNIDFCFAYQPFKLPDNLRQKRIAVMYFPPDFKRRLLKFADKINLFGNFSFGPGCLEIRCSKSYHLCDLELEDIFDNEVFEYVQLFSVRPQMKNRTRNISVFFHNSHYFRFRIARFNFKLAVCCCLSIGVYVFLACFKSADATI